MLLDNLDLNAIQDENAREFRRRLLNLVEKLSADLRDAQIENQRLRDEIYRLKRGARETEHKRGYAKITTEQLRL